MLQVAERSFYRMLVIGLCAWALSGCTGTPGTLPGSVAALTAEESIQSTATVAPSDCLALDEPSTPTHQALFDALNEFRTANGLEPVVYSRTLEAAANAHVRDLYERGYFAHINPDGENPGMRAINAGFCHQYVGENIAAGQKNVAAAQKAWENSPSHRENMLLAPYRFAGMGFYIDPTGRMYWAQEMAYDMR